ncbi:3-hydroxyacyl-CoA dehydrogenase [Marivirga sp. S37H4]|uniref:3-hydroxyacyl-CoA dehydrogenase n=1 Tax=Marivirga aurantiaca TaxID=2802615 RepID=A0A934WYF5_9BACT|nr:3-hydroxyacyl-CoA dehydrogenase family protein [Marivirga aurantiaca]MBK6265469.1 3-hydroxyacyl-CoA dehydrogenase [Marivirga aurantiaca]
MVILIVGSLENNEELKAKLGENHSFYFAEDLSDITEETFFKAEVVFDFLAHETPESLVFYEQKPEMPVFVHMAMSSFVEMAVYTPKIQNPIFGFNGFPTFINRPILECTMTNDNQKEMLTQICSKLGTDFEIVEDRVGMVTPRVIFMIINEAYYTVQEGTASKEDIDLGMKLGTNYPLGPFEWCERIGISNVVEMLEAIYEDTKEERYKICPLLKKEYLLEMANL